MALTLIIFPGLKFAPMEHASARGRIKTNHLFSKLWLFFDAKHLP
jgi:hypothetical protein